MVTSYVNIIPYLNSFSKFETYLVNFTNDLNSPDILAHFQEADTTHTVWARYEILKNPNYHHCSKVYQCRLLWQYRKIQEEAKYLGTVYYAVYQCFLSATDSPDYHPSMHTDKSPKSSHKANNQRYKRKACHSCQTREYVDHSADETEYLSKLMAVIGNINKELHHDI